MNLFALRRADLLKNLKADQVEAYYLQDATNVGYLTGLGGLPGGLFVSPKRVALVRDDDQVGEIAAGEGDLEVVGRAASEPFAKVVADVITKAGVKSVGVAAEALTLAELAELQAATPGVTFRPVPRRLAGLRAIKDQSEVEQMRAAVRVAERAFTMFRVLLHETDTEKEMADALESFVRRAGGRAAAFPPVVLMGDRGAVPHARPGDRRATDGSKLVVAWGADVGYKCYLARTLRSPFPVTPTRRTRAERIGHDFDEVMAAVLAAHNAALGLIKHETAVADVYEAARAAVADAGYADYFPASLGHGIGLEFHEPPTVSPASDETLRTGMVLALTSSVAIPEWGAVRVGDTVLVTKDGAAVLSGIPQDPTGNGTTL
jgi:Xaa-Pro aminopeptidase